MPSFLSKVRKRRERSKSQGQIEPQRQDQRSASGTPHINVSDSPAGAKTDSQAKTNKEQPPVPPQAQAPLQQPLPALPSPTAKSTRKSVQEEVALPGVPTTKAHLQSPFLGGGAAPVPPASRNEKNQFTSSPSDFLPNQDADSINGVMSQDLTGQPLTSPDHDRRFQQRYRQDQQSSHPLRPQPYDPQQSETPWSEWHIKRACPSVRFGHSANSIAARDGELFIMGGIRDADILDDLWVIDTHMLTGYQLRTEGPRVSPRVGHAAVCLGNAYIIFGGDTKMQASDVLDDSLYLLNTTTLKWTIADPVGPRPCGRYGHSLANIRVKVYVFGGQVENQFFNDLWSFELATLRSPNTHWNKVECSTPPPPPRTNHSVVVHEDKLYVFGGANDNLWYSDTWCFDPADNSWLQLECTGYIPAPCQGHAATLIGDVMYVFGGMSSEGTLIDQLYALKLSTLKWYRFQNLGVGPSVRSGHSLTAFHGDKILVWGGTEETNTAFVLDVSRISYPPEDETTQQEQPESNLSPQGNQVPEMAPPALPRNSLAGVATTTPDQTDQPDSSVPALAARNSVVYSSRNSWSPHREGGVQSESNYEAVDLPRVPLGTGLEGLGHPDLPPPQHTQVEYSSEDEQPEQHKHVVKIRDSTNGHGILDAPAVTSPMVFGKSQGPSESLDGAWKSTNAEESDQEAESDATDDTDEADFTERQSFDDESNFESQTFERAQPIMYIRDETTFEPVPRDQTSPRGQNFNDSNTQPPARSQVSGPFKGDEKPEIKDPERASDYWSSSSTTVTLSETIKEPLPDSHPQTATNTTAPLSLVQDLRKSISKATGKPAPESDTDLASSLQKLQREFADVYIEPGSTESDGCVGSLLSTPTSTRNVDLEASPFTPQTVSLRRELLAAKNQVSDMQYQHDILSKDHASLERKYQHLHDTMEQHVSGITATNEALASLQVEQDSLARQKDVLESENAQLKEQVKASENALKENEELKTRCRELEESSSKASGAVSDHLTSLVSQWTIFNKGIGTDITEEGAEPREPGSAQASRSLESSDVTHYRTLYENIKGASESAHQELEAAYSQIQGLEHELLEKRELIRSMEQDTAHQTELRSKLESERVGVENDLGKKLKELDVKYQVLEGEYHQSLDYFRNQNTALERTREELSRLREENNRLQTNLDEARLSTDPDVSHASMGSINTRQAEFMIRDLKAQIIITEEERDELRSQVVKLKKAALTQNLDIS